MLNNSVNTINLINLANEYGVGNVSYSLLPLQFMENPNRFQ